MTTYVNVNAKTFEAMLAAVDRLASRPAQARPAPIPAVPAPRPAVPVLDPVFPLTPRTAAELLDSLIKIKAAKQGTTYVDAFTAMRAEEPALVGQFDALMRPRKRSRR